MVQLITFNKFFFKSANPGLFLFIFVLFSLITISIIQIEKKRRWCAWDSNPGPQDGRHRHLISYSPDLFASRWSAPMRSLFRLTSSRLFSSRTEAFRGRLSSRLSWFRIDRSRGTRSSKISGKYQFKWGISDSGKRHAYCYPINVWM